MALMRGLIYIGFVVAVLVSWYVNNNRKVSKPHQTHASQPEIIFTTPDDITKALEHTRWSIRLAAVETLRRQDDTPQRLQYFIDRLDDPVIDVREAAVAGIIAYENEALPHLAQVLNTGKLDAREAAVKALCEIGTPETSPILVNALQQDESAWVRIPAAQGLGQMGGAQALKALRAALDDTHLDVAQAAREALQKNHALIDV